MKLKFLLIALFLLATHSAKAWTKVFDCSGSNAVIDRDAPLAGSENYQVVFRDPAMIGQLLESGAVDIKRLTSLSEIVLMIRQNEMKPGEWIGEADSFLPSGVVYFIRPVGEALVFETFRTTQSSPQSYIVLDKVGAWQLKDCHRPQDVRYH